MNTEAWDEFIKLEEEANSILVGPSTVGRVGKYVSKRQRLNTPAANAPAETERPLLVEKRASHPLERIRLAILNQQGEQIRLVELAGRKQDLAAVFNQQSKQAKLVEFDRRRRDLVAAIAKAIDINDAAAGLGRFAVAKADPKADKRKKVKRKAYR